MPPTLKGSSWIVTYSQPNANTHISGPEEAATLCCTLFCQRSTFKVSALKHRSEGRVPCQWHLSLFPQATAYVLTSCFYWLYVSEQTYMVGCVGVLLLFLIDGPLRLPGSGGRKRVEQALQLGLRGRLSGTVGMAWW